MCRNETNTEATIAAVRADYDANVAELMADLEGTRGEKEQTDTELSYLKVLVRGMPCSSRLIMRRCVIHVPVLHLRRSTLCWLKLCVLFRVGDLSVLVMLFEQVFCSTTAQRNLTLMFCTPRLEATTSLWRLGDQQYPRVLHTTQICLLGLKRSLQSSIALSTDGEPLLC